MKNRIQGKTIVIAFFISLLLLLLYVCNNEVQTETPTEAVPPCILLLDRIIIK